MNKETIKIRHVKRIATMRAKLLKKRASLDIANNSEEVKKCIELCRILEKVEARLEKAEEKLEKAQEEYRKAKAEHDRAYQLIENATKNTSRKTKKK